MPIRRVRAWQPHWLTEDQIAALLCTTDGTDLTSQRDRTLLMLGLFAGLHTGELHRLRWREVMHGCESIEIVGKGARPATAVAPLQLRDQLQAWRTGLEPERDFERDWPVSPRLDAPRGDRESVVVQRPVRPLSIEGIRLVVNGHGNEIGLDYLRPHDLRRTLAGTLDARGMTLQDIRVVMRHETLTATQSYLLENPLRAHERLRSFWIAL